MSDGHLLAGYESVDQVIAPVTPITRANGETFVHVNGDNFQPRHDFTQVVAAYVGAANAEIARLNSATLASQALPYITPLSATVEPGIPTAWADWRRNPLELLANEDHQVEVENDGAGSAQDVFWLLWLYKGVPEPVEGPWRWVRATSSDSSTDNVWSTITLALDNPLKKGTYEVGGLVPIGPQAIAARIVQTSEHANRPGVLAYDAVTDAHQSPFQNGAFGALTQFEHNDIFDLEALCDGTDGIDEVLIQVRKVA